MMDQVFGEPFSANEYDADPMVAMSELERAIQDRLAEHELRFTHLPPGDRRRAEVRDRPDHFARIARCRTRPCAELGLSLTGHHHHLICESCRLVRDTTLAATLEQTLDDQFDALADAEGFTQTHHSVDVYGLCPNCR
ncbi:hypothetical protein [Ilumatobacter sp.]|jgi:hypothetical protein|nr:hypothetical protein [Ilumatobacter sp.]MDG1785279.1 hypothetical protein [Ilumatobacter sp.]